MSRTHTYEFERTGRADPERLFDLIRDAHAWADWAGFPVLSAKWANGGRTGDTVVGQVRLIGTPPFLSAEEITVDRRPGGGRPGVHSYRVVGNWPVRDYFARVEFIPGADGVTTVRWSGRFTERIPGTGIVWKVFVTALLGHFADRLVAAAR